MNHDNKKKTSVNVMSADGVYNATEILIISCNTTMMLTCNGDNSSFSLVVGQICFNEIIASLQNLSPITSSSSRPYLWAEKKRRKKNEEK